ncbi:hypothetical protein OPV22_002379 [Ensete ventricosum]|uniref:Uncharacterized protein n=1 Tax=Ensete ventricosum TaxID=4639 RepID=A0AAV8RXV7_ENSVE|nr:hypothetical protein OPV22_002379 [Ensete ventricosum]
MLRREVSVGKRGKVAGSGQRSAGLTHAIALQSAQRSRTDAVGSQEQAMVMLYIQFCVLAATRDPQESAGFDA